MYIYIYIYIHTYTYTYIHICYVLLLAAMVINNRRRAEASTTPQSGENRHHGNVFLGTSNSMEPPCARKLGPRKMFLGRTNLEGPSHIPI